MPLGVRWFGQAADANRGFAMLAVLCLALLPFAGHAADASAAQLSCYDFPIAKEFERHPNLVYARELFPQSSLWFGQVIDYGYKKGSDYSLELTIVVTQIGLQRGYSVEELDRAKNAPGLDARRMDLGEFAIFLKMDLSSDLEREEIIASLRQELDAEPSYLAAFGHAKRIDSFGDERYPFLEYSRLVFGPEFVVNFDDGDYLVRTDLPFGQEFLQAQQLPLAASCASLQRCDNRWDKSAALRCAAEQQLKQSLGDTTFVNDFGARMQLSGFRGEQLDTALAYIDELIELVPENPDAHYMKTEVLFSAARYRDGVDSIAQALEKYNQKWARDSWISFSGKLTQAGMIHELIRLSQLLLDYYPADTRFLANIAAAYGMLGDFENGMAYARKVYAENPDDYINSWNLGHFAEKLGQIEDADNYYRHALQSSQDSQRHNHYQCLYADFLERRDGNAVRACEIRSKHCTRKFDAQCLN